PGHVVLPVRSLTICPLRWRALLVDETCADTEIRIDVKSKKEVVLRWASCANLVVVRVDCELVRDRGTLDVRRLRLLKNDPNSARQRIVRRRWSAIQREPVAIESYLIVGAQDQRFHQHGVLRRLPVLRTRESFTRLVDQLE